MKTKRKRTERETDTTDPVPTQSLPDTSVLFGLVRFINYLGQEFDRKYATPLDISVAEWRVLFVIGSRPRISAAEVTVTTGYSEMHVSRIVRHLISKGDVSRSTSSTDRRRRELVTTSKGRRIYERLLTNTLEAEDRCLRVLTAEDADRLRAIVRALNSQFGDDAYRKNAPGDGDA